MFYTSFCLDYKTKQEWLTLLIVSVSLELNLVMKEMTKRSRTVGPYPRPVSMGTCWH